MITRCLNNHDLCLFTPNTAEYLKQSASNSLGVITVSKISSPSDCSKFEFNDPALQPGISFSPTSIRI